VERGSCCDRHALESDKLQFLLRCVFDFQAQSDGFAAAFGNLVERAHLCVAAGDLRNRVYVIAFGIALNDDIELRWQRMNPRFTL